MTEQVEIAIQRAVSKVNWGTESVFTTEQRAGQMEKAVRECVQELQPTGDRWWCSACNKIEVLDAAHTVPAHRHDKHITFLRRVPE